MIICRSPLRISFIGGGSDLPQFYLNEEGRVISTAIDKFIYISAKKKFEPGILASYSETEDVKSVNELRHPLIRESLLSIRLDDQIEISSMADVPKGTGLGSSSAFTVCLLHALKTMKGQESTPEQLAEDACNIEIEKCRSPIGKQDQYASAFGGLNEIIFHENDAVSVIPIKMPLTILEEFKEHLMLFFTGITRDSKSVLQRQSENLSKNSKLIHSMKELVSLVEPFRKSLIKGEMSLLGEILNEGWEMKKKLSDNISNGLIDDYYSKARATGAYGGKILGAGNGGYLMLLAPPEKHEIIARSLDPLKQMRFNLNNSGSEIIFQSQ